MNELKKLKETYDNCIEMQKSVIKKNRLRLCHAEKERNYEEMRRLRYVLNILYDEKNELECLALSLAKYA